MKLIIENIRWPFAPEEKLTREIGNLIKDRLNKLNIRVKDYIDQDFIQYDNVEVVGSKGHLFASKVKNIRPLSPGDPRIAKLGRDYLESNRLTKEQWDGVINTFKEIFDGLKLHADIKLYEYDNDATSFIALRTNDVHGTWPSPTKFTVPKQKG